MLPSVDVQFTGGAKTSPLHARLRLVFPKEQEREEHYCVRAIQQSNAKAYQVRLKGALTQSGIDRKLSFRHLAIIRTTELPGGALTQKLTEEFTNAGGVFLHPTEDELRTLHALHELTAKKAPGFEAWLREHRHASNLAIVKGIVPTDRMFGDGTKTKPETTGTETPVGGSAQGRIWGRRADARG